MNVLEEHFRLLEYSSVAKFGADKNMHRRRDVRHDSSEPLFNKQKVALGNGYTFAFVELASDLVAGCTSHHPRLSAHNTIA
jgi:hypothetical protein